MEREERWEKEGRREEKRENREEGEKRGGRRKEEEKRENREEGEKGEGCVLCTLRESMLGRLPLCSSFSSLWLIVSTSCMKTQQNRTSLLSLASLPLTASSLLLCIYTPCTVHTGNHSLLL